MASDVVRKIMQLEDEAKNRMGVYTSYTYR